MNQNEPKTFITLDGNTLMTQAFEPLRFSVEKILPHGLFILAGSPKIGKSWMSLDLCQAVATGGKLWDFNAIRVRSRLKFGACWAPPRPENLNQKTKSQTGKD